jgi:hypothetical protein
MYRFPFIHCAFVAVICACAGSENTPEKQVNDTQHIEDTTQDTGSVDDTQPPDTAESDTTESDTTEPDTTEPDTTESDTNTPTKTPLPEVPNLVFQTGFEAGTQHVSATDSTAPCTDDLLGVDLSVPLKGDWESDLEGGAFGVGHFCFGGGTSKQRGIALVPDPDDPNNQVLHTWIAEPNENVKDDDDVACNEPVGSAVRKARVQHVLKDNPKVSRIDYRVRLRLGQAFQAIVDAPHEVTWMTIGEFWNNQSSEKNSFRITLNMVKHESKAGAPLYFGLKSDKQNDGEKNWAPVWPEEIVSEVAVPIGQWFILEVSITEGDENTGRAIVHVTTGDGVRHEVADVTGWTRSPTGVADGFKDINTIKLYTSGDIMCSLKELGHVLEIWWDDYAIGAE